MQPLIPVRLQIPKGTKVNIECWAWVGNIKQDNLNGYGYVQFSMQVNN